MKTEQTLKNYLPLKLRFFAGCILFLLTVIVGTSYVRQIANVDGVREAVVQKVNGDLLGYKSMDITFTDERAPRQASIYGKYLPLYEPGTVLKVYLNTSGSYSLYNPTNTLIPVVLSLFGSLYLIKSSFKKHTVNI